MPQKTYVNILKFGVLLSLVCQFFVFKNLLFPYITSKQIPFNMLVEILFLFWIALIVKYPEYRPKKSYITIGLAAFLGAITLSAITGVDFNLSFWGDVERMLGVFHVLHFFGLYLIIITVFRTWKDWKILFILSIILSVFISLKTPSEVYSTIGNTSYVSGLIIFNLYFIFLLFLRERHGGLKWLYLVPIPILLYAFRLQDTTGALVGLGFSIIVLCGMYTLLNKNRKVKAGGLILGLLVVAFFGLVLTHRDAAWVKSNGLTRSIAEINFQKNTFQTRLLSWKAAAKDFRNHPILGTGFGNYAIIFDKYFDPHFYDYTSSETYFDRAHNNVIDIASTSGLAGILAYLSIFGAVGFYLIRTFRRKRISVHEFIILTCLLVAYFVQNLAVFDSFVTYLALMMTLGYIFWLDRRGEEDETGENASLQAGDYWMAGAVIFMSFIALAEDQVASLAVNNIRIVWIFMGFMAAYIVWAAARSGRNENASAGDAPLANNEIFVFAGVGLLLCVIFYQFSIKPLKMLIGTIDGQRAYAAGDIVKTVDIYRKALSYNTVLDRDSRTSLNRIFAGSPNVLSKVDHAKGQEILDYNIELADANVAYNVHDSLDQMLLAQVLETAATYNANDQAKFTYYSDRALEAINKSIDASPGRMPIYFQKAQILINRGDEDGAIDTLEYAASLNDNYRDSFCHLGRTLLYYNREDEAYANIDHCIDLNGASLLTPAGLLKTVINHYVEAQDWTRVTKLYEQLVRQENTADNWVKLAQLYARQGETDKAVEAAQKVGALDKSYDPYVQEFINGLSGQSGQ